MRQPYPEEVEHNRLTREMLATCLDNWPEAQREREETYTATEVILTAMGYLDHGKE